MVPFLFLFLFWEWYNIMNKNKITTYTTMVAFKPYINQINEFL